MSGKTLIRGRLSGFGYVPPGGTPGQHLAKASLEDGDSEWVSTGQFADGSVKKFGAVGDGVSDDTGSLNNAIIAAHASVGYVYLPSGTYKVTSELEPIQGQISVFGDGRQESTILFVPNGPATCMKLENGSEQVTHVALRSFGIKSTETTFTKVALDVYDLGTCLIDDLYIWGSGGQLSSSGACWSGNGSIGLRTHGRDAVGISNLQIIADKPIYIDRNQNEPADVGEDIDHWNFQNCYLIANGFPIVEAAAGVGIIDLTFDGYQAWVGGNGGFKMNDTRPSPVVPSRNISFKNVRTEQQTAPTDYAIDIASSFPIQQLVFENCLFASGSQGIRINAADHIIFQNVTTATAAGSNALNVTGQNSRATIRFDGCYWGGITANFTLTNYDLVTREAFTSANFCGPSIASYVFDGQRPGTSLNMESLTATCANGATGLTVGGLTGDVLQANPQAAGNGVSIRAVNNAKSDFEPMALTGERVIIRRRVSTASATDSFILNDDGSYSIEDGVSAPATSAGFAKIYVDVADGDLKVKFGDGTIKTIVTDT